MNRAYISGGSNHINMMCLTNLPLLALLWRLGFDKWKGPLWLYLASISGKILTSEHSGFELC